MVQTPGQHEWGGDDGAAECALIRMGLHTLFLFEKGLQTLFLGTTSTVVGLLCLGWQCAARDTSSPIKVDEDIVCPNTLSPSALALSTTADVHYRNRPIQLLHLGASM